VRSSLGVNPSLAVVRGAPPASAPHRGLPVGTGGNGSPGRPATQPGAPRRRTGWARRPRFPARPPPCVPRMAVPYTDCGPVATPTARSTTHPVGRQRVGRRSHEQVVVHQHRGDRHPPPLLLPRTARLPAPVAQLGGLAVHVLSGASSTLGFVSYRLGRTGSTGCTMGFK